MENGGSLKVTNITISPNTGVVYATSFNISATVTDPFNGDLTVYCNVSYGAWYENNTMSYVSGDNTTGALYTYIDTYPTIGTLTVTISAYNNESWASSSTTFTVLANASFQLNFPTFLEVGDYILADGTLVNSTGEPIDGTWVTTRILNSTFDTVPESELKYYVTNSIYRYIFSTTTLTPGVYYIVVNYTYYGENFSTNRTLYLSDTSGPGHYATDAYFTFYNSLTGIGIEPLSFKI